MLEELGGAVEVSLVVVSVVSVLLDSVVVEDMVATVVAFAIEVSGSVP